MTEERQNSASDKNLALKLLGELFIMGVPGFGVEPQVSKFIRECNIGGVLYFSKNFDHPEQIAQFSNELQECRQDLPLWIAVDYEGGRVQRFKKGFTRIPDAKTVGSHHSPSLTLALSELIASELKAVGINLNFAPVLDILTHEQNPVIGDRAFARTAEEVTQMGAAFVAGHLNQGVQPCIKHFPGHGDTETDSHLALPRIDIDKEVLQAREWLPFVRAFKLNCNFVMTAHILNPKLDPNLPATLSKHVVTEILRQELHYRGLVVSDDLDMKAITDHYGAKDAPRMAIEAGCDLLIYRTDESARVGYQALSEAIHASSEFAARVISSATQIQKMKTQVLLPYTPVTIAEVKNSLETSESRSLVERIKLLKI